MSCAGEQWQERFPERRRRSTSWNWTSAGGDSFGPVPEHGELLIQAAVSSHRLIRLFVPQPPQALRHRRWQARLGSTGSPLPPPWAVSCRAGFSSIASPNRRARARSPRHAWSRRDAPPWSCGRGPAGRIARGSRTGARAKNQIPISKTALWGWVDGGSLVFGVDGFISGTLARFLIFVCIPPSLTIDKHRHPLFPGVRHPSVF